MTILKISDNLTFDYLSNTYNIIEMRKKKKKEF